MKVQRATPVSQQVVLILEKRIQDRQYVPGSRLPPESKLAEELGVSRATIRTAMARLQSAGLILRKQGDGTYVTHGAPSGQALVGALGEFWPMIESSGRLPKVELVSIETRPASVDEATLVQIEAGTPIVSTVRLFLADQQPVILTCDIMPLPFFSIPVAQVDFNQAIDAILLQSCAEEIAYTSTKMEAVVADEWMEPLLQLKPCSPLLNLKDVMYGRTEDRPIAFSDAYLNTRELDLREVRPWP
jgi:GntR family transcriptional regulator